MIEAAVGRVEDADDDSDLVGFVLVAVYSDGTSNSIVHKPSLPTLEEGLPRLMGGPLFRAWIDRELDANMAWGEACEVVNTSNGYEEDGNPPTG